MKGKERRTSFLLEGALVTVAIVIGASWVCLTSRLPSTHAVTETPSNAELVLQTGHAMSVEAMAFSPDGKWLASGSVDNTVRLWEVATSREVRTLSGHTKAVKVVAFSSDGRLLASGSIDDTTRLWNLDTGRELQRLQGCGSVSA